MVLLSAKATTQAALRIDYDCFSYSSKPICSPHHTYTVMEKMTKPKEER